MSKLTVKDVNMKDKKVLCRVDFNVPLKDGNITDDRRIQAALPTIRHLMEQNCRVVLMSHLGRPKGEFKEALSMAPVIKRLSELLEREVIALPGCIEDEVAARIDKAGLGEILVLENTRFYKGEKKNDPEFAAKLARYGEIFVSDAFGTVHRAHASTVGVSSYLPSIAGMLLEKEIRFLGTVVAKPEKPFVVILGGAKISDKVTVIENLARIADKILIGGAMAFSFMKAKGGAVGNSLVEEDAVAKAGELLETLGDKIVLPVDALCTQKLEQGQPTAIHLSDDIPDGWMGVDIGPEAIKAFEAEVSKAKTVVWNGPMGVFEIKDYAEGTHAIAKALAAINGMTVIGGGDSAAAITQMGFADQVSHVSTGGGASLEYLEGKVLPGVDILKNQGESI